MPIYISKAGVNYMKRFDIYEMVTNLIIQRLEAGVVPWQMPWKSTGAMPRNLVSKKAYRGFNFWYLLSFNFENPLFLTFNQVKQLGGSISKGSKSYQVIFWKLREYKQKDGSTEEVPMLRYYRVFNVEDVGGLDLAKIPQLQSHDHEFNSIEACANILDNWLDKPVIETGKSYACYIPSSDVIRMPDPRTFFTDSGYFSTLFHECVHCVGHAKRLKRDMSGHFGDHSYGQEELIAEMGAAYLCGICGIENETINNSAAYIQSWLSKLKNDNKLVVMAASHAQRAVDYILEHQRKPVVSSNSNSEKEAIPVSFSF